MGQPYAVEGAFPMNQPGVITVGSIHIDLVAHASRRPVAGESFAGTAFHIAPGGKGANQAIQARLSGARSYMVGRLGDDVFAPLIYENFDRFGVDRRYVVADPAGTGVGNVVVDAAGDYSTVTVERANDNLCPHDVDAARDAFCACQALLLQLEVPIPTVLYAAQFARALGLAVFLNAAPAACLPDELLDLVDVLVVNEIEAQMITGITLAGAGPAEVRPWLEKLHAPTRAVVITLGPQGVVAMDRTREVVALPGHGVKVVNTIGAGDAFIGELATRMAEGLPLPAALPYANAAGALAVEQAAAQGIMIDRERVLRMIAQDMRPALP